ncbi:hypothetical protein DIU31_005805 [Mucilaginibacter rubeus]|uniref:Uncharacterized protein n=1 Tax=Mucilaginibacter rubeus TaxID=2027860 RepID=A0AAE6JCD3_9SPHI|nr:MULTISPECIES: hypothetical protein [Mucilaginibacter]QEM03057.1 hypothetical protein DIU31_005805 [Mucilaginibacter rubeus]QEM15676.1 hypothetical protein DIU38_005875 [Mucilaginibacter gossypii]QTE41590.1 hypothetical protein J3L19_21930 [Mucilaginibacter rubeus]QTE48195.1 hypothetical protein J3L21_21920 [Mucilaginibacter rubeus]QTE59584.1 hypothetical protein J3L23_13560 [Mucilaginibacter rubeus]
MELDLKINLPEDFTMLCEIFAVKPQFIIQLIIDQISFPRFYAHSFDKGKWATLIFLDYLDNEHHLDEKEMEFNEHYLEKFSDAVEAIKENSPAVVEEAAREVIREWHKAISKERAKYLLDNLPKEE